ncbi:hypothetical protein EUTSA_v10002981mg [Eutrema salsugineum]|uniref:F-box domain-containing protein n=1 Tax=Eutrema salsugineum TaxID=72664 RepID=V4KHB2_EUTSA|nr:hypothetical protein EUTSA_v10002981mg [Eutrema salsugineum]
MSHIPLELVEEILYRVPVTSLIRLRTTCKGWNALLKDRGFIEKKLRKAPKQSLVLMLKEFRTCSMSNNLNIADPSIEFKVPLERDNIFQLFQCGGLLLFTTNNNRLVSPFRFVLGYENNNFSLSYKILRCYQQNYEFVGLQIYDFSSDSWRVLLDVIALDCLIASKGVSLKGNAYWLAYDKTGYSDFLISFDFTRERFKRLCLPEFQNLGWMALSVERDEKISVLHRSKGTLKMDIWMTNKVDTEAALWSLYFTVDIPTHHDDYISYLPTSFLIDEEKKLAVCCNAKYPLVEATQVSSLPSIIFSYVPSLVQIQQ